MWKSEERRRQTQTICQIQYSCTDFIIENIIQTSRGVFILKIYSKKGQNR